MGDSRGVLDLTFASEPAADSGVNVKSTPLFDRVSDHGRQLAHQAIGDLARHRKFSRPLEFLDRGLGIRTHNTGGFQLAVTVFGERALHGRHAV